MRVGEKWTDRKGHFCWIASINDFNIKKMLPAMKKRYKTVYKDCKDFIIMEYKENAGGPLKYWYFEFYFRKDFLKEYERTI